MLIGEEGDAAENPPIRNFANNYGRKSKGLRAEEAQKLLAELSQEAIDACPGYSPLSVGIAVVQEVYWRNLAVHVAIGAYPYRHKGVNPSSAVTETDKLLMEDDRERGWHYEKAGLRYYFPKLGDTYLGFAIKSHSIKAEYLEFSVGISL